MRPKPVSASNPPESRGDRELKTVTPMVDDGTDNKEVEKLVYEPTQVEPSPKKKSVSKTK